MNDKSPQQMIAEVLCRLFIEAMTGKSGDTISDTVVQGASFSISLNNQSFKVSVSEIKE
jgi:hypothetical protein